MRRFSERTEHQLSYFRNCWTLRTLAWFINSASPEAIILQFIFYTILGIIMYCLGMFMFFEKEAILIAIGSIVCFFSAPSTSATLYLILLIAVLMLEIIYTSVK